MFARPCRGSGGLSLLSHCAVSFSIRRRWVWELWWRKWHSDGFFFPRSFLFFPCSVSFKQSSTIIFIYMLLLPEGQAGDDCESINKSVLFRKDQKDRCWLFVCWKQQLCCSGDLLCTEHSTRVLWQPAVHSSVLVAVPACCVCSHLHIWQHYESSMFLLEVLWLGRSVIVMFLDTEQSDGKVTDTSWKALFAKTFSPKAQEIVKQNAYNLVWFGLAKFYILFAIEEKMLFFSCNK